MNTKHKKLLKVELAKWAIDKALKYGANESSVNVVNKRSIEIVNRNGELEKLKESTQNSLSISIYTDNKYSNHSTNNLNIVSLEKFIKEAVLATNFLSKDKFRALPEKKYYPTNFDLDLKQFDKNYENIKSEKRIEQINEIIEATKINSKQIVSSAATYYDTIYSSAKVHSNGFEAEKKATIYITSAEVSVKDNDARPEDWFMSKSLFYNKLPSNKYIGGNAANRALQKIGQKKIKSNTYNMIVENRASSKLVSMLLSPLSGKLLQQKSSYLENMLNKKIASEKLTIIDNPFVISGFASKLYDNEGIASKKRTVIENGILKSYYINNYYGKKLNMYPNGGSSSNLEFTVGNMNLGQLCNYMDNGILVTGFLGGNSNTTTGDFSFGISGFLIKNGIKVQPISEMNISGNSKEFWNKLIEIGNDKFEFSAWQQPSLLFENISFSGI